jgi:hypothetical protein
MILVAFSLALGWAFLVVGAFWIVALRRIEEIDG